MGPGKKPLNRMALPQTDKSLAPGDPKINSEADSKKREKDIANASRKLLSLAIAPKPDLERNSGSKRSGRRQEGKWIESLWHDMKEIDKDPHYRATIEHR